MAIGNGDAILLKVESGYVGGEMVYDIKKICEFRASDIKVLNLFIFNEAQNGNMISFDLLSSNGRSEIIKFNFKCTCDSDAIEY